LVLLAFGLDQSRGLVHPCDALSTSSFSIADLKNKNTAVLLVLDAAFDAAFDAVAAKETKGASQSAALQTQIVRDNIEAGIGQFQYNLIQTLCIRLANH
jgi:hypothetical protein